MEIAWFIQKNISSIPRINPESDSQENINIILNWLRVVNAATQVNAAKNNSDVSTASKMSIYMASSLHSMARMLKETSKFIEGLDKNDSTYQIRMAGFHQFSGNATATMTLMGIYTAEPKMGHKSKLFMLKSIGETLPLFKKYLSREMMMTPTALFKRFDVTDQQPDVIKALYSVREQLSY